MNIPSGTGTNKEFELPPEGAQMARCYLIADLGTTYDEKYEKDKREVMIGFELPKAKMTDDRPFVISQKFTLSLHEKSNLFKTLAGWQGKPDPSTFDIKSILGASGQVTVVHNKSGERTYANIAGVSPLMEGLECPPPINPQVIFDFDEYDVDAFDKLPEWIQKKVMVSKEWFSKDVGEPEKVAPF